jgi:hypothetical protein
MEEESLESISQIFEILWDSLGIKKSIAGLNIRKLLTDYICSAIIGKLDSKELQKINVSSRRLNSELNKIISDIIKLHKKIMTMSLPERKILLYALLLVTFSALFPHENTESVINRVKIVDENL